MTTIHIAKPAFTVGRIDLEPGHVYTHEAFGKVITVLCVSGKKVVTVGTTCTASHLTWSPWDPTKEDRFTLVGKLEVQP